MASLMSFYFIFRKALKKIVWCYTHQGQYCLALKTNENVSVTKENGDKIPRDN